MGVYTHSDMTEFEDLVFRAKAGDAQAQCQLGWQYDTGQGVPQDHVQAHMWSNLVASRATDEVRENAVSNRDTAAGLMTPTQIAEAQRLAREWDAAPAVSHRVNV